MLNVPSGLLSRAAIVLSMLVVAATKTEADEINRSGQSSSVCASASKILLVSLDDLRHSDDVLSPLVPEFPNVLVRRKSGSTSLIRLTPKSNFWRVNWVGEHPSPALVRRWFAAPYRSIADCYRKSERLHQSIRLSGGKGNPHTRSARWPVYSVVRMTYPVFDRSGTRAIVLLSLSETQGMEGRVELVLLARDGSKWTRIGSRVLSIS